MRDVEQGSLKPRFMEILTLKQRELAERERVKHPPQKRRFGHILTDEVLAHFDELHKSGWSIRQLADRNVNSILSISESGLTKYLREYRGKKKASKPAPPPKPAADQAPAAEAVAAAKKLEAVGARLEAERGERPNPFEVLGEMIRELKELGVAVDISINIKSENGHG